jgi:hypothetical protein
MRKLLRAFSIPFLTLAIVQEIRHRRMNDRALLFPWLPESVKFQLNRFSKRKENRQAKVFLPIQVFGKMNWAYSFPTDIID